MQDVAYADSYTATRIAAAIAEPSSGRHLRYVTVMDPGVHPSSPTPGRATVHTPSPRPMGFGARAERTPMNEDWANKTIANHHTKLHVITLERVTVQSTFTFKSPGICAHGYLLMMV